MAVPRLPGGRPRARHRAGRRHRDPARLRLRDRLYLATSDLPGWGGCADDATMPPVAAGPRPVTPTGDIGRTRVHAFALDDVRTTYVASGVVDGTVADPLGDGRA